MSRPVTWLESFLYVGRGGCTILVFSVIYIEVTQHDLLKGHSFSTILQNCLCHKSSVYVYAGLLLDSLFSSNTILFIFQILNCLNYCNFIKSLVSGSINISGLYLILVILGPIAFPYKF